MIILGCYYYTRVSLKAKPLVKLDIIKKVIESYESNVRKTTFALLTIILGCHNYQKLTLKSPASLEIRKPTPK
jgi:hypothetical protein